MTKGIMFLIGIIVLTLSGMGLMIGAGGSWPNAHRSVERIDNVVAVVLHEPGRYAIITEDPTTKLESTWGVTSYTTHVSRYADIPANEYGWAEYRTKNYRPWASKKEYRIPGCLDTLIIHYHGASELRGGGWDHGKFGRGQTNTLR